MSELLDWAEKSGLENLKGHHQTADTLKKEGVTTLTVLLAGATGGLAYTIKGFEADSMWWAAGSAGFAAYLYLLSGLLVFYVLSVRDFPALYNEPANLYQPQFSVDELREVELENIQARICQAILRNKEVSTWLNRIRYAAVCSPLVFGLIALVAWACLF